MAQVALRGCTRDGEYTNLPTVYYPAPRFSVKGASQRFPRMLGYRRRERHRRERLENKTLEPRIHHEPQIAFVGRAGRSECRSIIRTVRSHISKLRPLFC
jgi:hypothetical protein